MRYPYPTYHCRTCGEMPRQILQYAGLVGKFPKIARHYRCGGCDGFALAEKVTRSEIMSGDVEDHEMPLYRYYYLDFQSFARRNGLIDDNYFDQERHAMNNNLRVLEVLCQ